MTRVAIVNAVYPPEPVVSAHIGADLANYLAARGTGVTVLCPFPTRPYGARYPGFQPGSTPCVKDEGGVRLVRLPSFTAPESRLLPRMWESFSFGRHAARYVEQQLSEVDVIYVNSWPLLSQALVARVCERHRIPLVLHIQDIYPESLLNRLPAPIGRVAGLPLTALDRWIAARASTIVVISPNMERTYVEQRGVPPEKVVRIFDWQDESRFVDLPERAEVCARHGVPPEPLTFVYLGSIGPVAGVESLITAFARVSLTNAQLLIIGDGSNKQACVALTRELGLSTVRFLACPTPEDAPVLQQMADVCLLPVRSGAGMSSVPSKLMAYLLSAKPVLAAVDADSDTARCIREAQCGWVGKPEDVDWMAERMAAIASLVPDTRIQMGERGRRYALKVFSKAENVRQLASVVLSAKA
jgi:glycosyltransferase involved in cell wall biosynthesis